MKNIPLLKLIFIFYKLPEEIRGSVYASIIACIEWEKKHHDQKGDKRSKKDFE